MSKQSDAKGKQGFNPKPLARCCRTCGNLKVEKYLDQWSINHPTANPYWRERLTCAIGGFTVKAQAVCDLWEKNNDQT